jgi:hypothetical protein
MDVRARPRPVRHLALEPYPAKSGQIVTWAKQAKGRV